MSTMSGTPRRLKAPLRSTSIVAFLAASVALLAGMLLAQPAFATPKGEFEVFSQCPLSNAEVTACIVAKTESGEVVTPKKKVPITNPITLQGGFIENPETLADTFVGAANGETITKTPQPVPGGLIGGLCAKLPSFLKSICERFGSKGFSEINAITELAGSASSIGLNEENLIGETGTALALPIKVKLDNLFLGTNCYIGSNSHPISLNLTTGTTSPPEPNKPISGKLGTPESNEEGNILTIKDDSLVDNAFSIPVGAAGCGGIFSFLVNPVVNSEFGVPSTAGHNTAILNGTLKQAGVGAVKAHE